MEWPAILFLLLGVVIILVVLYAMMAKRHDAGPVPGHFDFDRYKESELSRRGLFDKTKWQ